MAGFYGCDRQDGQALVTRATLGLRRVFMFDTLYRCPRTIARHENGLLAESRRRYLEHLAAQGAAIHTIRAAAGVIYRATMMMRLDESSPVERRDVERAAKHWAQRWYRNASSRGPTKPTRSSGRLPATGYDSPVGSANQIVRQFHTSRRSMRSVSTWMWRGGFRRKQSKASDRA